MQVSYGIRFSKFSSAAGDIKVNCQNQKDMFSMCTHISVLLHSPDFSKQIFPTLNSRKQTLIFSLYVDLCAWCWHTQAFQTQGKKKFLKVCSS